MSGGMNEGTGDELVHREVPSPNHGIRTLPISMAVIHYTEMKPVEAALARMCDPASSVSAHYCITEEGEVIRLVPEDMVINAMNWACRSVGKPGKGSVSTSTG